MRIIYTESGRRALDSFKDEQVEELEKRIASRKYVFGDEVVEITAADVKQATEKRGPLPRAFAGRSMVRLVLKLYLAMGILVSIFGLFREELSKLYFDNPYRFAYVIGGLSLSVASYAMLRRYNDRDREIERLEEMQRFEQRK